MDATYAVVFAVIQAATEFLPVSSSGHLLFLKGVLGLEEIPILFDIIVHVGSLTAILFYYRKSFVATLSESFREMSGKRTDKNHSKLLLYLALSTVVTFLFYLLFKDAIEIRYTSPSILPVTFLCTTVLLSLSYFSRNKQGKQVVQLGLLLPLIVGLFQGFAIMPGISRSGFTIAPMLLMGVEKKEAGFYSFSLAVPAILGALVFKLMDVEGTEYLSTHVFIVVVAFLVSAVFSYLFLALLNVVLGKGKFWMFSFYTLLMAVVSFFLF